MNENSKTKIQKPEKHQAPRSNHARAFSIRFSHGERQLSLEPTQRLSARQNRPRARHDGWVLVFLWFLDLGFGFFSRRPFVRPGVWFLLFLWCLDLGIWFLPAPCLAAAAEGTASAAGATNTFIHCTNGVVVTPTSADFRGGVRVFDPQLYLECDFLTVYYPSNSTGAALRGGGAPDIGRVHLVVARSNVLMMLQGTTIIGDDAVYSATNDIIQVTGGIVAIETESGYAYGTNFVFNRQTMEMRNEGPITLESKASLIQDTNRTPNTPRIPGDRPRRTPAPGNPLRTP